MNVYLAEIKEFPGYEMPDGYVIVAKTLKEARDLAWIDSKNWTIKKVSKYTGEKRKPFVVLMSDTGA